MVPDALSRLELATLEDGLLDLNQWVVVKANDKELKGIAKTSLVLDARQTANRHVYFDVALDRRRLLVPQRYRRVVFTTLHGRTATSQIIMIRFVSPGMDHEIR